MVETQATMLLVVDDDATSAVASCVMYERLCVGQHTQHHGLQRLWNCLLPPKYPTRILKKQSNLQRQ